jgi:hypothetical protein
LSKVQVAVVPKMFDVHVDITIMKASGARANNTSQTAAGSVSQMMLGRHLSLVIGIVEGDRASMIARDLV